MHILFLDVCSHDGLIAAVTPDTVVASAAVDHRITDAEFVPAIEGVLKKAKWTYKDVTHIACVVGPGGFTSTRVGVSAANALAWALGVPSCGVHLSDLYHARFPKDSIWLHSTKKKEIFLRGFGAFASLAPVAQWMPLEDALAILPKSAPVIGELIPDHRAAIEARGLYPADLPPVQTVLPAFLAAQRYDKQTLQPWYGRQW